MIEIPLERLAFILLPLVAVGWISFRWGGSAKEFAVATARMIVQLLGIGYVLVFLFKAQHVWTGLAVVAFMIAVSSWIAIRTIKRDRRRAFADALLAVGLGGGAVLALVITGILQLSPWYQPSYLIPLAGMTFSNAMTAVTLSAERFEAEFANGKLLTDARNIAWNAALIPQINTFLAVGLVALPGMMTGQILAGASPLDAVRYQILVMGMVMASAGFAVAIFLARTVARHRNQTALHTTAPTP